MEAVFRIGVQWLHVTAGVLWIGGGFYTILVQLPALLASPPAARGAVMPNLAPRQLTYTFRVAEFTILTGVLNLFVSGRPHRRTRDEKGVQRAGCQHGNQQRVPECREGQANGIGGVGFGFGHENIS